jgi:hypothetical protein
MKANATPAMRPICASLRAQVLANAADEDRRKQTIDEIEDVDEQQQTQDQQPFGAKGFVYGIQEGSKPA